MAQNLAPVKPRRRPRSGLPGALMSPLPPSTSGPGRHLLAAPPGSRSPRGTACVHDTEPEASSQPPPRLGHAGGLFMASVRFGPEEGRGALLWAGHPPSPALLPGPALRPPCPRAPSCLCHSLPESRLSRKRALGGEKPLLTPCRLLPPLRATQDVRLGRPRPPAHCLHPAGCCGTAPRARGSRTAGVRVSRPGGLGA